MCPPLFSEAPAFGSILVSDHYSLAFWVVAYERFDFYRNALSTSRRVIFINVWPENNKYMKKRDRKGTKNQIHLYLTMRVEKMGSAKFNFISLV